MTTEDIEYRAEAAANEVLTYFHNLETLGNFAGEPVEDQKRVFLTMCFKNFFLRERGLRT